MKLQDIDYCEETWDDIDDFINSLRISKDIYTLYRENLPEGEWQKSKYVCNSNPSLFADVLIKYLGVKNMAGSGCHEPASKEVWAFKVRNGYLITDEMTIYF